MSACREGQPPNNDLALIPPISNPPPPPAPTRPGGRDGWDGRAGCPNKDDFFWCPSGALIFMDCAYGSAQH